MNETSILLSAIQAAFTKAVQDAVVSQVTVLQQQHANVVGELATKVAALEARLAGDQLAAPVTDLQLALDKVRITDALDSQEWFWAKIQNFVEETTERVADAATIAENLSDDQLNQIGRNLDTRELIRKVDFSDVLDYSEIADVVDLSNLAEEFDLAGIAGEINLADLAGELNLEAVAGELDLAAIAEEISATDVAGELDLDQIAGRVDLEDGLRTFFQNNTFSIRP
jgi:hypothetical protein